MQLPSITYSGAYPLSRLDLSADPSLAPLAPSLYAYSPFKPGSPEAAAHPAAAFSLAASNPAGPSQRGAGGRIVMGVQSDSHPRAPPPPPLQMRPAL